MDDVAKLLAWLKIHGNSAPWEEVQHQFRMAFPTSPDTPKPGDLKAVLLSNRGLPLYGRTSV